MWLQFGGFLQFFCETGLTLSHNYSHLHSGPMWLRLTGLQLWIKKSLAKGRLSSSAMQCIWQQAWGTDRRQKLSEASASQSEGWVFDPRPLSELPHHSCSGKKLRPAASCHNKKTYRLRQVGDTYPAAEPGYVFLRALWGVLRVAYCWLDNSVTPNLYPGLLWNFIKIIVLSRKGLSTQQN